MSEDQIAAFLSRLNDDALLREKFQNAPDLDTAVALAEEAGLAKRIGSSFRQVTT